MRERDRMVSQKIYYPGDEELWKARCRAKALCRQYNDAPPEDDAARADILRRLLGSVGKDCWIEPTLRCDYGTNISIGDYFFANYDCVFLDVAPITIGNNVWIGAHATVLAGVTIGDNAVIAAGAVVNRDIPADTVAAGVPAKVIRKL